MIRAGGRCGVSGLCDVSRIKGWFLERSSCGRLGKQLGYVRKRGVYARTVPIHFQKSRKKPSQTSYAHLNIIPTYLAVGKTTYASSG